MSWEIYGNSYDTDAEFSGASKTIRFKPDNGTIVTYFRTWIIGFNDPVFTNITAKIYSDVNGEKGSKLHDSITTHLKASIATQDNFVKEIYFEFDNIALDSSNWYHIALSGTSTGFSASSHLAWRTSFPYPVYDSGLSSANVAEYPYTLSAIGASF
jgi:hypothetical protein